MFYILSIVLILIIDQFSKYLTVLYIKPINSYPLINQVFHLTYAENRGAAFSIFSGKQMLLIIVTALIITLLGCYFVKVRKSGQTLLKVSLSLIIGGAMGNLVDRLRLNYVVDMLDFTLINYPIFNMADVFVVTGAILLSYYMLKDTKVSLIKG
ncbi:signal peptidase II [Acetoanaerobium noterae]|uniref:Lipoprotein signal peptidase n=2 Tax=Acetoanaerobium noterae TaxID=745369 RepID=A0A1T5DF21_9FIRM|nr:signal peptidase II [Acetoanaerobium noterae]